MCQLICAGNRTVLRTGAIMDLISNISFPAEIFELIENWIYLFIFLQFFYDSLNSGDLEWQSEVRNTWILLLYILR